jgi:hypothetical protein
MRVAVFSGLAACLALTACAHMAAEQAAKNVKGMHPSR